MIYRFSLPNGHDVTPTVMIDAVSEDLALQLLKRHCEERGRTELYESFVTNRSVPTNAVLFSNLESRHQYPAVNPRCDSGGL